MQFWGHTDASNSVRRLIILTLNISSISSCNSIYLSSNRHLRNSFAPSKIINCNPIVFACCNLFFYWGILTALAMVYSVSLTPIGCLLSRFILSSRSYSNSVSFTPILSLFGRFTLSSLSYSPRDNACFLKFTFSWLSDRAKIVLKITEIGKI